MHDEDRLTALEAELAVTKRKTAALETELAQLKTSANSAPIVAEPAPKPRVDEREVRIIQHPPEAGVFEMPSDDELDRLTKIVWRKHPYLEPKFDGRFAYMDSDAWRRDFRSSFIALGRMRRATQVNQKRAMWEWQRDAESILALLGLCPKIDSTNAFFCAALATGEVPYLRSDETRGIVAALGLWHWNCARGVTWKAPGNGWREVLRTGEIGTEVVVKESSYPRPDVRIAGGNNFVGALRGFEHGNDY